MDLSFILEGQEKNQKGHYLIVSICTREGAGVRKLYRAALEGVSSVKLKEALAFLIREELRALGISPLSWQAETAVFNRVRISGQNSYEALKLLGATGSLFHKGKKIFVDPFNPASFTYEIFSKDDQLIVSGKWRQGSKEGFLHECSFFFSGESPWLIVEGTAYLFNKNCDCRDIKRAYPEPFVLKGKEKTEFYEEFKNDPHVIWKVKEEIKETAPLPFLVLKDRTAAFADLWMDYGSLGKIAVHDEKVISWRKKKEEAEWEKDLLEAGFMKKECAGAHYYAPLDKAVKSVIFLLEIGWQVFDLEGKKVARYTSSDLKVERQREDIVAFATITYEDKQTTLGKLLGALKGRERLITLQDNVVGLIDEPHMKQLFGDFLEEKIEGDGVRLKKGRMGLLPTEVSQSICFVQGVIEALPSTHFKGVLYPYQQQGVDWLSFLEENKLHGLLADEMGLGKTVQVLAFLSRYKSEKPCLIVAPTSLLFNWKREIETFLPSFAVYVHSGGDRREGLPHEGIILTSYAILRQDAPLLQSLAYGMIVLDEAQTIKNPLSQIAEICFGLKGDFRLSLTGTPVENRWEDLWSHFRFLMPDLLDDRSIFDNVPRMKRLVRPFLLRRRKEEVSLDLPPKMLQTVWVDMLEGQRLLYEELAASHRKGLLKKIKEDPTGAHNMEVLEAILRLRQMCCHPLLAEPASTEGSAKLERLLADLEEVVAEGRKVLVFSQFTQMLQLIEKGIQDKGFSYVYLDGSSKNRQELVDRFQQEASLSIFLISLKAGGVGLNLTAADYVFLFDPWWNEAIEQQAIDRAHRIGRKGAVIARRYLVYNSIEEKIMRLKEHKASLAAHLFEGEGNISALTLDELSALLL